MRRAWTRFCIEHAGRIRATRTMTTPHAPQSATHAVCQALALYGMPEKRLIFWDEAEHIVTRREALGYTVRFTLPNKIRRRARGKVARVAFYIDARGFKRQRRIQDAPRKRHTGALEQALTKIA